MKKSEARKIILITEDDVDIREMLQDFLRIYKFDSDAVRTGLEALKRIREKKYDLYIIDYALPDVNGFEIYKKLREINSTAPVLFYTAFMDQVSLKRCGVSDPNLYIFPKTSSPEALIRGIEILLRNNSAD